MNDDTVTTETTTEERAGFCQNCGKPLNKETIRVVGTAVYCEPCLAAKLAGAPGPGASGGPGTPGYGAGTPSGGETAWQWVAGMPSGQRSSSGPNPALAGLLGLIPGVGAMYNEQYAKGVVHLAIFAILVSLSHASDIFGLFTFGWICYMAIEAHHTARARRDGTPLPNPFGFNDIGERMGFARNWPNSAASAPPPPVTGGEPPVGAAAPGTPGASWGAPSDQFAAGSVAPTAIPVAPAASYPNYAAGPAYGPGYGAPYTAGYDPNAAAYAPPSYAPPGYVAPAYIPPADLPVTKSRFPAGAIWLIALGTIFLVANTGMFRGVPDSALVGLGLVALSVWIFVSKMLNSGPTLQDDGSPMYGVRVMRASRGAVWVLLVGVLLLLNAFGVVSWARSWPYFIILAGVMAILERTLYNSVATHAFAYPPPMQGPLTETRVQLNPHDHAGPPSNGPGSSAYGSSGSGSSGSGSSGSGEGR